jgi:hypothetical protein
MLLISQKKAFFENPTIRIFFKKVFRMFVYLGPILLALIEYWFNFNWLFGKPSNAFFSDGVLNVGSMLGVLLTMFGLLFVAGTFLIKNVFFLDANCKEKPINIGFVAKTYFWTIPFFVAIVWGLLGVLAHILFSFSYSISAKINVFSFYCYKSTLIISIYLIVVGILYCIIFFLEMKNSDAILAWSKIHMEKQIILKKQMQVLKRKSNSLLS